MAWAWVPYAISAGLSIASSIWGGSQDDPSQYMLRDIEPMGDMPAIGDPDWGAMAGLHEDVLSQALRPLKDPSQLMLESQRMDVAGSGAYLQGVSQMEQKYMDVMAREMGIFELQQGMAKTEWSQKKFMMEHEWEKQKEAIERQWRERQEMQRAGVTQQAQQRKAGTIESIFGSVAGGIQGGFGAMQEQNWMDQIMKRFGVEGFDFMMNQNLGQMGTPYKPTPFTFEAETK